MRLRCGGIFNDHFFARLLLSLLVNELFKSVNIWHRLGQSGVSCFFDSRGSCCCTGIFEYCICEFSADLR